MPELEHALRQATGTSVPGVVVVVVGAEGVRDRRAAGLADAISRRPMTIEDTFPWFSMTKIATATTALRLVERGTLELDAPVAPLAPAMRSLKPQSWAARITVRHLLQHSAGLANPIPLSWIHPADQPGPDLDVLSEHLLAKHRRLRFRPGTRSRYSNLGSLALGGAMSRAAAVPFQTLVQDELLGPLGMVHTGFVYEAGSAAATGHHPRHNPLRLLVPRWVIGRSAGRWTTLRPFLVDGAPYAGLVGSATDIARLVQMHIRDGELDGTRILSAERAAEMRQISMRGNRYDLGLGWFVPARQRSADPPFVEHLGGGAGFFNVMRIYPSLGVGIVVMGNATKYDINKLAELALKFV